MGIARYGLREQPECIGRESSLSCLSLSLSAASPISFTSSVTVALVELFNRNFRSLYRYLQ